MSTPFGMADYHRENPYGSGHFSDAAQAKILTQGRGPIARVLDQIYRFNPAEPSIVFGGAGSGKGATIGTYQPVHPSMGSFFLLDMGGQYLSTTFHWNLAEKREVFVINPEGASTYPDLNYPFHLFGILKNDDFLFDNARRVAAMGLRDDAKGDNAWVGSSARRWLTRLMILLVLLEGRVTPKRLWQVINEIDSDDDAAKAWGRASEDLPYKIHATLAEIYQKKQNSEREYGAIMGKIKDDLDWLSSPKVADSVSGDEDILSYLPDPNRKIGIYFALKSGSGKMMESLTRMVTGIAMLHCMRCVQGALPCFYLEEAATLGRAEFVKQAVSECRKYFHTVLVYQSLGQLNNLFEPSGAQEILDSCGQQIFLGGGVRDYNSALKIANTIGKTTITLDNPAEQRERAYRAEKAMRDEILHGGDPLAAAEQHQHQISQSYMGRLGERYVIDPAEIMRLKNEVIILSPGAGAAPVLANKMPNYWDNAAMAGRFAPDPLFPPLDRVKIKRKYCWGYQTRQFIREAVPEHLARWPNHCSGEIAYVKGYKTF